MDIMFVKKIVILATGTLIALFISGEKATADCIVDDANANCSGKLSTTTFGPPVTALTIEQLTVDILMGATLTWTGKKASGNGNTGGSANNLHATFDGGSFGFNYVRPGKDTDFALSVSSVGARDLPAITAPCSMA